MPGVDDQYLQARRTLLDALESLRAHLNAIILVGAQAIYLHTGSAEFAIAEFTTDADLALDPSKLAEQPELEQAMHDGGFIRQPDQPGIWRHQPDNIEIDLMVPEAVGGKGRRAARLPGHHENVARKARGLEAALVNQQIMTITALDPADTRTIDVAVADPAALLVAKLHKLWERRSSPSRLNDKDAFDIFRLLRAVPTHTLAQQIKLVLSDPGSAEVTAESLTYLRELFADISAPGTKMVGAHVAAIEDAETIEASCAALAQDLIQAVDV